MGLPSGNDNEKDKCQKKPNQFKRITNTATIVTVAAGIAMTELGAVIP